MSSRHNTQTEPSKRLIMNAALAKIGEPEVLLLLDNIESLSAVLYRFAPQRDRKSIEVFTLTQTALKTIQDEIAHWFAIQPMTNYQSQVENWENEGGRIKYASA